MKIGGAYITLLGTTSFSIDNNNIPAVYRHDSPRGNVSGCIQEVSAPDVRRENKHSD